MNSPRFPKHWSVIPCTDIDFSLTPPISPEVIAVRCLDGVSFIVQSLQGLSALKDEMMGRLSGVIRHDRLVFFYYDGEAKPLWWALGNTGDPAHERPTKRDIVAAKKRADAERSRRFNAEVARVSVSTELRRIRERYSDGRHSDAEWESLLESFGGKCLRCGSDKHITKDHIKPIVRGGSNDIKNLQPLCRPCNSWKGTRTIDFRPRPASA